MHLYGKAKKVIAILCALVLALTVIAPYSNSPLLLRAAAAVSENGSVTYDFRDGSIIPTDTDGKSDVSFGDLTVKVGTKNAYQYNGAQHGVAFKAGNSIEIKVDGPTKLTVGDCQFSNLTELTVKSADGSYTETQTVKKGCYHNDGSAAVFTYEGEAATLIMEFDGTAYVPVIITEPYVPDVPDDNGKTDVWDFGADQLDETKYNNMLDVDTINGFYDPSITPGSTGAVLLSFTAGDLSFVDGGKTNNRLRTANEKITRYDTRNPVTIDGTTLNGYVYSNSSATSNVRLELKLYENDILTLYTGSNGGASTICCESPSGDVQEGQSNVSGVKLTFYAPETGVYKIYSSNEKLVVYRALRQHPKSVTVSGAVDTANAAGIGDYKICFTNQKTGKTVETEVKNDAYSVELSETYTYGVSLVNANGYVIASGDTLEIPEGSSGVTNDIVIKSVDLVTATGKLTGLSADALKMLKLSFVSENIYVPEFTAADDGSFTVKLEKGVEYEITAEGVNDYELSGKATIKMDADGTQDITFSAKPVYDINVTLDGIPDSAKASAVLTFTNINEEGYVYSFKAGEKVRLRDGQYTVNVTGTGSVPYVQKITSNVIVDGKSVDKTVLFEEISEWDFAVYNGAPGIETIGENKYYLGLELSGNVLENKTYLLLNENGEIKVPVKKGQIVTLTYCYQASFEVEGKKIFSSSGSTTKFESTQVTASADGFMTIKGITGTTEDDKAVKQTYFGKIGAATLAEYKAELTVGKDKEYQTINAALAAAAQMGRPNNERVTIKVDPGNYEEMLVIDIPNVSIVNAAGKNSSLDLINKGVDIAENVVRITSYYGHGYDYYSMDSGCKYDADVLAANKANGSLSNKNPGSGTTNGSYWNSTVVVFGDGFEADGIVFENSFNQYISEKEANDIVVMWETGSKGQRPTTAGDTSVQSRSYVERAAALSIVGNNSVFNNCKFVGRQDTLYGGTGIKAVFQKCDILGAVDFIFGGMTAVFYQCNLVMNTDDKTSSDEAYITAAQQSSGRGYLMYNCTVTSTTPGVDTASETRSKPGYFGRPWQANTSEVVFFKTNIETTDYPDAADKSLIKPEGWRDSLGGQSPKMYEFGSIEASGEDNSASRAEWTTLLTEPKIDDGATAITIRAFLGDWTDELNERGLVLELVEFKDEETGIEAIVNEDTFDKPEDITFSVKPVADETDDIKYTFDISFIDADGNKVQPNGDVIVRIPVPETLKDKIIYVYHEEEDGTYTSIDFTIEDDTAVFTASKFSKYIITSEKLSTDDDNSNSSDSSDDSNSSTEDPGTNPPTGAGAGMAISFAALAAVTSATLVISKKKK